MESLSLVDLIMLRVAVRFIKDDYDETSVYYSYCTDLEAKLSDIILKRIRTLYYVF